MVQQILNAAPMLINYGVDDQSKRQLPYEVPSVPQHCPKFYLYTQKGPAKATLVNPNMLNNLYGADSFDITKKWFNHATIFATEIAAEANNMVIERIIPEDSGAEATAILWLDVLTTTVDLYERNTDGSIFYDTLGNPVIIGTTSGYKIKWVVSNHQTYNAAQNIGALTQVTGNQVDPLTGNISTRYPIFEFKMAWQGSYGNNIGFRIWSPNYSTEKNIPEELITKSRVYPYYFSQITRSDSKSPIKVVNTQKWDSRILFTLRENTINTYTLADTYLPEVYFNEYNNIYTGTNPEFDTIHIYQNNVDEIVTKLHASESNHIDVFSDITSDPEDRYLINLLGLTSTSGVPYHSIQFVDDTDALMISRFSNIFAAGGSDGTMSDDLFAKAVEERMEKYANPDDPVQDHTLNPESIFYDTGFPLNTKRSLCKFISQRKDTFVVLSTYDVNGPVMSASEEFSTGSALKTFISLYPESDYFGTPVLRGLVMSGSCRILNNPYKKRVPNSFEIAYKSARYMGAANAIWKTVENFDHAPGNVLRRTYDHSLVWLPASARNYYWSAGINWIQAYDYRLMQFPALKTVYGSDINDDTSILNSYFTAMAICYLQKIVFDAWKEYTGVSSMSDDQLADAINDYVRNRVAGKFDNRFVIEPQAQYSELDKIRGFSWQLPVRIYGYNMKTVMTTYISAYRMSDLELENA